MLKAKMIHKAVLCIKGQRIAGSFGLCLINLIVSVLFVCIYDKLLIICQV